MKRKVIMILLGLLLVASHFFAWAVGYMRGNICMSKVNHKINLLSELRAYHALASNDFENTSNVIELGVMRSSRALDFLDRDPYGYFIYSLSWIVPSDATFRPRLEEGLTLTAQLEKTWKKVLTKDGRELWVPPR